MRSNSLRRTGRLVAAIALAVARGARTHPLRGRTKARSSTAPQVPGVPHATSVCNRSFAKSTLRAALCAGAVGFLAMPAAHAQVKVTSEGAATLEEIVVTAQRREERLLDVPLSVTAVTAAEIAARGVTSLQDMQYAIPGLTMSEFGPGQGRLQLDGIGTAGGATGLPTVGRYLDEMPITADGAGAELDLRLLDLQRVEVLHGPQPTLYGEGSMGGTIHFVTAPPDLANGSGHVEGQFGSVADGTPTYNTSGVINAPLIKDVLGVRLVAGFEHDGGWIDSRVTGQQDINDVEITTLRGTVLYKPMDALSVSLMVLHQEHSQRNQNYADAERMTGALVATPNKEHYDLGNLVISYDFGPATLLSSTGYLNRQPNSIYDQSAYFVPALGDPAISTVAEQAWGYSNMFSQELRLASNGKGPFNYTVGAYYRLYRTESLVHFITGPDPNALPFPIDDDDLLQRSETTALFGEVRYAFTDRFELLLGLRHFKDKRSQTDTFSSFGFASSETDSGTFSSNNPRLDLSYKTSASGIVYLNIAKGFRSGGFNTQAFGPTPPTYAPETLWNAAVGTKQAWLDDRLFTDLSVYYNKWTDIQQVGVIAGTPNGYTDNSGKASGPGVNFILSARPIKDLTLSATLGYADMKYDTDSRNTNKGDPIDMVTKWTYSAAADYRVPLSAGMSLLSRLDYAHTSGYQLTLRNTPFTVINPTGSRDVVDARVGVDFGQVQLYLFANNLTDDNGILYPSVGTLPEPIRATPRTLGIGLKADF